MREIFAKVKLVGLKNEIETDALLDTGSTFGHVSKEFAEKAGFSIFDREVDITLADKSIAKMKLAIGIIEVNGCASPLATCIAEKYSYPIVIGTVQMEAMGIKIDPQRGYTISCKPPMA